MTDETALVLFSGGQDSATCLAWALARYREVETIGFAYGQRHAVEMTVRAPVRAGVAALNPAWEQRLGADHVIDLSVLGQVSESSLTRDVEIAFAESGLPNSFVPGRNLAFLTFAAMLVYRRGARHIVGGMCETDFSGYPDCRDDSVKAMQLALNIGMDRHFVLHTPLMWRSKAETWRLAQTLGGEALVELIRAETHTCYLGERGALHEWGHGCGTCPAANPLDQAHWKL